MQAIRGSARAAVSGDTIPPMPIPLFDTATPLDPLRAELRERVVAVLDDRRYILGPDVEAFEREFADYLGVAVGASVGGR